MKETKEVHFGAMIIGALSGYCIVKIFMGLFPNIDSDMPALFTPLYPNIFGNVVYPYALIAAFLGSLVGAFIAPAHQSSTTGDCTAVSIAILLVIGDLWSTPGIWMKVWGLFVLSCAYGLVGHIVGTFAQEAKTPKENPESPGGESHQ